MNRVPVESAVVREIGYDQETRTLEILFPNNSVYQYPDFSLAQWNQFAEARSKGIWFNTHVRGKLAGKKVEEKKPEPADYSEQLRASVTEADK